MKAELLPNDGNLELSITAESFVEEIALKAWSTEYLHDPAKTTAILVVRPYMPAKDTETNGLQRVGML